MTTILELKNITKHFPGVLANDSISLSVEEGEVHTLLGENGAGKSTLMNIVCGLYHPTSGQILLRGKPVAFSSARDAMNRGIGMVHQHFMLVPNLSVVENCLIGLKSEAGIFLNHRQAAEKIRQLGRQYNMEIDPLALVSSLSVGQRQRVEIIKALMRGARILILDEPTAVLTPQETGELFRMIRELTASGFTILFISHKLNEVKEISDRVSVLRWGRLVSTHNTRDCTVADLARLMVGRDVSFGIQRQQHDFGPPVVSVQHLTKARSGGGHPLLDDVVFEVHSGEILGIAGVDGNGQAELVECLTGLQKAEGGTALYDGKNLLECKTRQIMANDISHIPQDRQRTGLAMSMNLVENIILQDYYKKSFGKGLFVDWGHAHAYCDELIQRFSIKTPSRYELAQNLSGGNQQKVVIARELTRKPRFLIAMHPTRGLDVGAIEYIHSQIMAQRDAGVAILLVSTELDEVMKLSDRVAVMYEGKLMGILPCHSGCMDAVSLMMGGTPLEQTGYEAG